MRILLVAVWLCPCVMVMSDEPTSDAIEFFEQRIRPVLVEHCYECHNSANTAEAGLALDHRAAMQRGGDSGSLLDGTPGASLLIQVIRHDIDGLEMPEAGPKLDREVIADFEKWLSMGAPDPRDAPPSPEELAASTSWEAIREKRKQWWSFQPIIRPAVPPAIDGDESTQPLDCFIQAKLPAAGLRPAEEADRAVLARRVSFALTGLPPAAGELARYLEDPSPTAYEDFVDRLLDSERFGEHWARHWMDWIRYAESHGSEGDPRIVGAHHYRDYLIRSLNNDIPYDQLIREHVAGDLLEAPRINEELGINESQVATAHWRMVFHGFAPTDVLDEKVRFTDDAINVFSKAFLGLTVSCARCHDHKFDAISQADYYALFGVVGSARPGRAAIDSPSRLNLNRDALSTLKNEIREAIANDWLGALENSGALLAVDQVVGQDLLPIAALLQSLKDAEDFQAAWQERMAAVDSIVGIEPDKVVKRWNMADPQDRSQWFAYGNGTMDRVSPAGEFSLHSDGELAIRHILPAGVYSHLLSDKHAARLTSPEFELAAEYDLWILVSGGGSSISRYVVQDYPRDGTVFPVTMMRSDEHAGWHWKKYDLGYWTGDTAHIELATANDSAVLVQNQARSWFGVRDAIILPKDTSFNKQEEYGWLHPIFEQTRALSAPSATFEEFTELFRTTLRIAIADWRAGRVSDAQALLLNQCLTEGRLPNSVQTLTNAQSLIEHYRSLEHAVPVPTRAPALAEWEGRNQRLYERGDHKRPGERIPRRFLEAIDETPYETELSGRRQLAEDVLRDDNPLTARVIVNRIWHHLFGRGIVATNDNFGRLGQAPTHPELLDYLTDEFRTTDAWSIKSMIRRIVTSKTWRQDFVASSRARAIDPENQLYSYRSITRLEAEAIRDSILSASGQLNLTMFGESVPGETMRRSVYVQVIRNSMDPFLATFDAPVPFSSKGRRDVTNVPAQSLLMLNNPFVLTAASALAKQSLRYNSHDEARATSQELRIERMWQRALGRPASLTEIAAATEYLASSSQRYDAVREQRRKLQMRIDQQKSEARLLVEAARQRLLPNEAQRRNLAPEPVAEWSFMDSEQGRLGTLDLKLHGDAKLQDGALILGGNGWASTDPITVDLEAKTLEATVQLSDLAQQGGGLITIQDLRGDVFDSIVFSELAPGQWLAGSDYHRRTKPFSGEAETSNQSVHIAITFDSSGTITCYRNGEPYGRPYKTDVQTFKAGEFEVLLGMRHGKSPSGNRMLSGRILQARLYNRALTAEEVRLAADASASPSKRDIEAAMTVDERNRSDTLQEQLVDLQAELDSLPASVPAEQPWIDLAHSLFNMKEFIYVR